MKVSLLLPALLMLFLPAFASDDPFPKRNMFSAGIGYTSSTLLDKNASDLLYGLNRKSLAFGYQRLGDKIYFGVELSAGMGGFIAKNFKNRFYYFRETDKNGELNIIEVPVRGSHLHLRLQSSYLHKFAASGNAKAHFYAGLQLKEEVNKNSAFIAAGTMNILTLHPKMAATYKTGNRSFMMAEAAVSALGLLSRAPYHGTFSRPGENLIQSFFKHNTNFYWLNDLLLAEAGLKYFRSFSNKSAVSLGYNFGWNRITEPALFKSATHQFQISYNFSR